MSRHLRDYLEEYEDEEEYYDEEEEEEAEVEDDYDEDEVYAQKGRAAARAQSGKVASKPPPKPAASTPTKPSPSAPQPQLKKLNAEEQAMLESCIEYVQNIFENQFSLSKITTVATACGFDAETTVSKLLENEGNSPAHAPVVLSVQPKQGEISSLLSTLSSSSSSSLHDDDIHGDDADMDDGNGIGSGSGSGSSNPPLIITRRREVFLPAGPPSASTFGRGRGRSLASGPSPPPSSSSSSSALPSSTLAPNIPPISAWAKPSASPAAPSSPSSAPLSAGRGRGLSIPSSIQKQSFISSSSISTPPSAPIPPAPIISSQKKEDEDFLDALLGDGGGGVGNDSKAAALPVAPTPLLSAGRGRGAAPPPPSLVAQSTPLLSTGRGRGRGLTLSQNSIPAAVAAPNSSLASAIPPIQKAEEEKMHSKASDLLNDLLAGFDIEDEKQEIIIEEKKVEAKKEGSNSKSAITSLLESLLSPPLSASSSASVPLSVSIPAKQPQQALVSPSPTVSPLIHEDEPLPDSSSPSPSSAIPSSSSLSSSSSRLTKVPSSFASSLCTPASKSSSLVRHELSALLPPLSPQEKRISAVLAIALRSSSSDMEHILQTASSFGFTSVQFVLSSGRKVSVFLPSSRLDLIPTATANSNAIVSRLITFGRQQFNHASSSSSTSSSSSSPPIVPFDFSTPSPDDKAAAVKDRRPGTIPAPSKGSPASSPAAKVPPKQLSIDVHAKRGPIMSSSMSSSMSPSPSPASSASSASSNFSPKTPSAMVVKSTMDVSALPEGMKPNLNLIIIGHVDAGKSTMMGHLLVDMGHVSQKQMHKFEKESKEIGKGSFAYAWVMDETSEERARGVTMDVAVTHFETPSRLVTLMDAPGHKDFVPNMISGAAQADCAILVISSAMGEFEGGFDARGQTKEHALLVRSLGVSQLIVAVNKLDNMNWSQERFEHIRSQLQPFLKQAGFKESSVWYVPVSGLTGENLTSRATDSRLLSWYSSSGPCLVELIDRFEPAARLTSKPLRLTVTDVFKNMALGTAIGGKVESGVVRTGDRVVVLPSNLTAVVKSIQVHGGVSGDGGSGTRKIAYAGESVEVGLDRIEQQFLSIGQVLCDPAAPAVVTRRFDAQIITFGSLETPITRGFQCTLYSQSINQAAVITKILAVTDRNTGAVIKKKPIRCLTKNMSAIVRIVVQYPMCIELATEIRSLGRFTLREAGNTLAAGLISRNKPFKTAVPQGAQ